ncbi:MAG TPA: hypothetical protein VIF32_11495 [Gemmatimonadaceae bacterium]
MGAHNALSPWETFFFLIGSSGAALTGLQFVVIALVAETEARTGTQELAAFGTPNIVHFCAVLLVSAILSAPWPGLSGPATAVGICGVIGIVYAMIVVRRARRTTNYKPVLEDWIWHAALPLTAYVVLALAAVALPRNAASALFAIAGSVLLLLFIGIHNAWDTVTYLAVGMRQSETPPSGSPPGQAQGK